MPALHSYLGRFEPQAAKKSVHLGNIQPYRYKTDVQALLERLGFQDCFFYWDNNAVTAADTHHAGWCWISFPDTTTALRARLSLDGLVFYGLRLWVGDCCLSKVLGRHRDWRTFDPKDVTQSIHLGQILRIVSQQDVQALLTSAGFPDCTFYWKATKVGSQHCHRGWCWIHFPDVATAGRAMICLHGLAFHGRTLSTMDCAVVGKAWDWAGAVLPTGSKIAQTVAQKRHPPPPVSAKQLPTFDTWAAARGGTLPHHVGPVSPLSPSTLARPLMEPWKLPGARKGYVSRGTQTDSHGSLCVCSRDDGKHVDEKEDQGCEDSEEDLMTFESPERPHARVSHDWW